MFWDGTDNQAKFRDFIHKSERLDLKMQILSVDFQKPWWTIILKQKNIALFIAHFLVFSAPYFQFYLDT